MKSKPIKIYFAPVILLVIFFSLKGNAQQDHFLYIQADGQQNFKAAVNGKSYTSSSIGYLIIPKLKDSIYPVSIDFTGDNAMHLDFFVSVNKKDAGYQLKDFGTKGWGLFNLQTMDIIMSGIPLETKSADSSKIISKTNAFGDMLGDVVNDSTLNKPSKIVSADNAITKSPEAVHIDTITANPQMQTVITTQPVNVVSANSRIIKAMQQSSDTGIHAMFVDVENDKTDTVDIFIPAKESSAITGSNVSQNGTTTVAASTAESSIGSNEITDSSPAKSGKEISNPFYNSGNNNEADYTTKASQPNLQLANIKIADENDLAKLRKKMIAETDANSKILSAKKQLKGKYVSTVQVKNIGVLFLSDEGRYDFYEAMYNFTYDQGNYISLQSQLISDYYKKRFQALLH